MTRIAISIIIPVYNVEPYVEDCLKSVMCQTCSEPMECILVDNCGTDNSLAIVERMVADYHGPIRFTIIRHDHNRGLAASRNTGIKHAAGEYLMFIDSDDIVHQDFCKEAYECAMQHQADLVMFSHVHIMGEGEKREKTTKEYRYSTDGYKTQHKLMDIILEHEGTAIWNKIYKKELFDGISFPEGLEYEDEGTIYKVVMKASCIFYLDKILYYYFNRPGSLTCQITDKFRDDRTKMNLRRYLDLKAWGYHNESLEYRIREYALSYLIRTRRDMSNKEYVQFSQIIRDTKHIPPYFSSKQKLLIYIFKYCPWLFELYYTIKGKKYPIRHSLLKHSDHAKIQKSIGR